MGAVRTFEVTTQSVTCGVTINVQRNLNPPVLYPNATYERTISRDTNVGLLVIQINATDADQVSNG